MQKDKAEKLVDHAIAFPTGAKLVREAIPHVPLTMDDVEKIGMYIAADRRRVYQQALDDYGIVQGD